MNETQSPTIIRGSVAPRDLIGRVASDEWADGWWYRPTVTTEAWARFADALAKRRLRGARFGEHNDALAVWRDDPLERALLGMSVGRVEALVAPPDLMPVIEYAADEDRPTRRLGDDALVAMVGALSMAVTDASRDGIGYLIGEVDTRAVEQVWAYERSGFELVDGTLRFLRRIGSADAGGGAPAVSGASIEVATSADGEAVASATVFDWDRYHADPMLPTDGADAVHRALVRQACQRQGADIAWVARDADGVLGFTAGVLDPLMRDVLGLPTLTITLAATAPRARRRGVGRALAAHAIRWASEQGLAAIEVGTPLRNIAAARTYEAAGFRLVASRLTFRSGRGLSE